jgi:prevent-host-death family protein
MTISIIRGVNTMAIAKFKATCLTVLEDVRRTRTPLLITKRGVPIAQVLPPPPSDDEKGWMGSLSGLVSITGDIVSPASDPSDWDANR